MKPDIHPRMHVVKVHCGCGNEFETYSTIKELRLEICGACHPHFTGKKRAISATGRVQRFTDKYKDLASTAPAKPKAKKAAGRKRS